MSLKKKKKKKGRDKPARRRAKYQIDDELEEDGRVI
jgi:hypothetical protein